MSADRIFAKGIAGNFKLPTIDRSAWVSWATFAVGAELVRADGLGAELKSPGQGIALVLGAVAIFLVLVLLIQRHMRLSLLAATFGEPDQLVTSGWFRHSRNPIYVAFLLPIAALGYWSLVDAAATAFVYVVAMTTLVIAREERALEANFGEIYLDYKARTPRWLWIF
jgi:protein-S-isoprenylcysteine O-methyltransferase Ste14